MQFVTTTDAASTFTTAESHNLQFAGNVTAGSLLVVHISSSTLTAVSSVVDDVNGAWTLAHADQWTVSAIYFYLGTAGGSAPTVTVTFAASTPCRFTIAEFLPTAGSTWTGKEASDHAAANSQDHVCASPAITSTNPNGVWIAGIVSEGSDYTIDSGDIATNYVQTTAVVAREGLYYRIATATETSDGDFHTTTSLQDFSILAYFYETAGAPPTVNDAKIIIAPAA